MIHNVHVKRVYNNTGQNGRRRARDDTLPGGCLMLLSHENIPCLISVLFAVKIYFLSIHFGDMDERCFRTERTESVTVANVRPNIHFHFRSCYSFPGYSLKIVRLPQVALRALCPQEYSHWGCHIPVVPEFQPQEPTM